MALQKKILISVCCWRFDRNDIGRGRGRSNFMPRLPNPRPAEKEWNNRYDRNEPHERRFPRDRQEAADGRDFQRPSHHDSQHGRYDNHRHHNRYHHAEEEPEWFTGGPTSQNETIELHGFDDEVEQLGKNKSAKTATSEPTLAGSRPPSSVDPVQEPCEGVRHSSPLPSGKSPEKKDGTLKGTEEETPKNFPMDFDGFFVGAEPEEVATSTGSRFRRFFTRQFEEENPGIEKESSAAEHKKNASDLINDQYSAPKNDPHARQTGRVSGESCELGGEILHLFRNALPDKNSVNRDGHSESLEKRAHIRELAIQGKVMNVSEIEGQRVEREPLPQSFHPPGNDMSAFQKLLAQVSQGEVHPLAAARNVDRTLNGSTQSTGYMGTVRPTLVVPGTNDRQIFMNNPGPLFQNQPYMGNKTTSSGLLDAIKDRRQQSFAVSEQLKKGVPLEEIEIPKPSFQPPTNKGAVSYPRDFAASMCMAGLDVERLSRPEAQYILKGLVDGRLSKLQIQFFSGASGQPENMKQAYAAVNRALECRFDPVSLLGDQGVKSLQDSGTRKPMLAAAPPPPLPGNVAFRPPSIPMSAGPPMMNEPSPREIAFQTQQLMNDAKMKQQQARMQQLMQQQAQIQARQEFQAQMQQMQADDFRRRQAEHQQQHLLHQYVSRDAEAVDQLAKLMARAGVQSRPLPLIPGEKIMSVADLERNLNAQPRIN
ncbi:unnamed protein product [Notodromas monacha]|uniref:Uncharacterized protein n=1 Tax=Notodromas monacha TaxID=399045 RepID=A0A7R9BGS3_9CRUS|nr:unnamed protein product [Notodromas monacha]CAG0914100.1 unnamed protein product [Notodromas monacha]